MFYVYGLIWGPWDKGLPDTYFKEVPDIESYTDAMRAFLGSPTKKYPLVRAQGKMQRALLGTNLTNKRKTPLYRKEWNEVYAVLQGKKRVVNFVYSTTPLEISEKHVAFFTNLDEKQLNRIIRNHSLHLLEKQS